MTEQELREKIAQEIGEWRWKDSFYGEYVTENDRNSCRTEAGLVIDLIKEAGYKSPVEIAETIAEQFPRMASEMGYVKLPPDSAILENVSLLKDIGNES